MLTTKQLAYLLFWPTGLPEPRSMTEVSLGANESRGNRVQVDGRDDERDLSTVRCRFRLECQLGCHWCYGQGWTCERWAR